MTLPKLVKDSPLPSLTHLTAQMPPQPDKIAAWKAWIDANSSNLKTLSPVGQNVNTSPASCSPYRIREKQWLAEITH